MQSAHFSTLPCRLRPRQLLSKSPWASPQATSQHFSFLFRGRAPGFLPGSIISRIGVGAPSELAKASWDGGLASGAPAAVCKGGEDDFTIIVPSAMRVGILRGPGLLAYRQEITHLGDARPTPHGICSSRYIRGRGSSPFLPPHQEKGSRGEKMKRLAPINTARFGALLALVLQQFSK